MVSSIKICIWELCGLYFPRNKFLIHGWLSLWMWNLQLQWTNSISYKCLEGISSRTIFMFLVKQISHELESHGTGPRNTQVLTFPWFISTMSPALGSTVI